MDDKLAHGNTFAAGEFSGIATRWDDKYVKDNWAGHCSATTLVKEYAEKVGVPEEEMSGKIFFEAANNGEEKALEVLNKVCDVFVSGIMSLQLILDVQRYTISGGISKQAILVETIYKKLDKLFKELEGKITATRPEVVACAFGNDANMIDALYHYLYEIK